MSKRIEREKRTVSIMAGMHCRHFHRPAASRLCPECEGLLEYSLQRTENCRFGDEKPVCSACPVHCYRKNRREQIRGVMRFAGPRMIWRHPRLAVLHLLDRKKDETGQYQWYEGIR